MRRFTVGAVALQFDQRRQKGMVVPASHMSSLSRRANEHRRVAGVRCPAEPALQFRVGVGRVQHRQYTQEGNGRCRMVVGSFDLNGRAALKG